MSGDVDCDGDVDGYNPGQFSEKFGLFTDKVGACSKCEFYKLLEKQKPFPEYGIDILNQIKDKI